MATGRGVNDKAGNGKDPKVADFDELVDEVLAKKGPAKYTDGLSEDNWESELEQIPLFMTRPPDEINAESAPALAALQDLIYRDETPRSKAVAYKEDGNEEFKKGRYKEAIAAYTAAMKEKFDDTELAAVLLCNRAAAQYHLGNYRSSLIDADESRRINPDHVKAIIRGAECFIQLRKYGEALQWCDDGLRKEENNSKLRELRSKATKEKKRQDRDKRKDSAAQKEKRSKDYQLIQAIKSRGVTLDGDSDDEEGGTNIELTSPHPAGARVHMSRDGVLTWPVMLLYPEFDQADYIESFRENDKFIDHLEVMLKNPPPWDEEKKFTFRTVQLYYEDVSTLTLWRVNLEDSLNAVLRRKSFVVACGTPAFMVLSTASPFTRHFLKLS